MFRKSLLIACAASALLLSGCSSVKLDSHGQDLSKLDTQIVVGKTTLAEVRALLGTPTMTALTVSDSKKVVGYAMVGHNLAAVAARNLGSQMLTLGTAAQQHEITMKNVVFKFDDNNVVTDYKKSGVAYISKNRFTQWNECEYKLSPEEVQSGNTYYNRDEICQNYAAKMAKEQGIPISEVDTGKEYKWCNVPCQNLRAANEAFGALKAIKQSVKAEKGDGKLAQAWQ